MQQSCQRCGKRFTQTGADKYCPACREELDSAQKKAGRAYKRRCAMCGREFETFAKSQRYCSVECRPSGIGEPSKSQLNTKFKLDDTNHIDDIPENAEVVKESAMATDNDPVKHPNHYTRGTIETKDFIRDKELNFNLGNAVKYVVRAGHKDESKTVEDLRKAIQYIEFEIDWLRKER